ncbi:polysaccharide pyruvyl transferase family protein [Sanguibacter sp. 25GB23B1]|uniref:polysaccharide pyruvyl transferase family protein n=1 Tax=unclassified Sanguibacter TaxID=2645534 RepID=UPI0032AFD9E4
MTRRVRSPDSTRSGPVVLVFGELGIGNLGNEASLTEALRRLHTHLPGARVQVLSYDPARTAAEHEGEHPGWSAEPIGAPGRDARAGPPPGRWTTLARQLADAGRVARASRGADLVVVPGTGIFEELWMGPWGVPVLLLGLAAGARAHRAPLVVVAVGADLPRRRLTRWMFSRTLRSARLVTFRDVHSLAAGTAMIGGRGGALLAPDLVLGAPAPDLSSPDGEAADDESADDHAPENDAAREPADGHAPPRLVLGVMRYYGTSDDTYSTDGAATHERYVAALADVARRVVERGWTVDVVVGDEGDRPVVHELVERLGAGVRARPVSTMRELDDVVAGSTAVVASRYHNVVSAIRAAVPVVSVSYGPKGHSLMAQVGMDTSCQWIEELDADRLMTQLDDVVARSAEITPRLRETTTTLRAAAHAPWTAAAELVGTRARSGTDAPGASEPTTAAPASAHGGSALVDEPA